LSYINKTSEPPRKKKQKELIIVCEELKRKGKILEPQNGWAVHTIIDWVITVVSNVVRKLL